MNNEDDSLLDSCLAEVLGGQSPPDLSARILRAWESRCNLPPNFHANVTEPVAPPIVASIGTVANQPIVQLREAPSPHRKEKTWSSLVAVVASALVVFVVIGVSLRQRFSKEQNPNLPSHVAKDSSPKDTSANQEKIVHSQTVPPTVIVDGQRTKNSQFLSNPAPDAFGQTPPFDSTDTTNRVAVSATPKRRRSAPEPETELLAFVNGQIREAWQTHSITPATNATDAEWCRRSFLRIVGRIPSVEELTRFTESHDRDKRTKLIDDLLNGSAYADEYAAHWSSIWANVLVGRSGGPSEDGLLLRQGLQAYLAKSLLENRPFDQLAFDLISATGSNQPTSPDFNGAVNFVLANQNERETLLTSRVSRVFLGADLQPAPANGSRDFSPERFWELNAFFRQLHVERIPHEGTLRVVNSDFEGEQRDVYGAEVFFELPNGTMKAAYPVFVDGTALPQSGLVSEVDRRTELAKLVSQSAELPRAVVNRIWAHFLGHGFTKPVDDMGPHNTPSHPELLERLAQQFEAQGHDLKKLTRWIALTDAFSLSSKVPSNSALTDSPESGTAPLFSRYYTRQMQAEELFQSLQLLANARKSSRSSAEQEQAKRAFLNPFTKNLGTDDGGERNLFDGTIPQSMIVMSSDLTQRATSVEQDSLLSRVAKGKFTNEQRIEHLFQAALARKPMPRELKAATELLDGRKDNVLSALQDLWWALLNSNEFILDH